MNDEDSKNPKDPTILSIRESYKSPGELRIQKPPKAKWVSTQKYWHPKMEGENNGSKPYFLMGWFGFGGVLPHHPPPIFGLETPTQVTKYLKRFGSSKDDLVGTLKVDVFPTQWMAVPTKTQLGKNFLGSPKREDYFKGNPKSWKTFISWWFGGVRIPDTLKKSHECPFRKQGLVGDFFLWNHGVMGRRGITWRIIPGLVSG